MQLHCSSQTGHQQGLNFEFSQPHSIFDCLIEKQVVPYSCLTLEGIINLGLAGECTAGTAPFLSWRWGNGKRTWERGVERTRTCLSITPGSWVYGQGEEEEEEEEGLVGWCSQLSRFWQVRIWGWSFFPCFVQPHCTGGGCPPNPVSVGGRRTCSCPSLESWCAEIRQFPLHPPGQQGKGGSGGLTSERVRSPDQECGLGATNPSLTHFHQMPGAVADLG